MRPGRKSLRNLQARPGREVWADLYMLKGRETKQVMGGGSDKAVRTKKARGTATISREASRHQNTGTNRETLPRQSTGADRGALRHPRTNPKRKARQVLTNCLLIMSRHLFLCKMIFPTAAAVPGEEKGKKEETGQEKTQNGLFL